MDLPDTKKNQNLNTLLPHIAKKKALATEQKQHHIHKNNITYNNLPGNATSSTTAWNATGKQEQNYYQP